MSDLSTILGAAQPLTFGAETHSAKPLTVDEVAELEAYINARLPDPLALARQHVKAAGVPLDEAKFLYSEAMKEAARQRVRCGSSAYMVELFTPINFARAIFLSVRKAEPAFTMDDAFRCANAIEGEQIRRFARVSQVAFLPGGDDGAEAEGPNRPAAAGSTDPASPAAAPATPASTGGAWSTAG